MFNVEGEEEGEDFVDEEEEEEVGEEMMASTLVMVRDPEPEPEPLVDSPLPLSGDPADVEVMGGIEGRYCVEYGVEGHDILERGNSTGGGSCDGDICVGESGRGKVEGVQLGEVVKTSVVEDEEEEEEVKEEKKIEDEVVQDARDLE